MRRVLLVDDEANLRRYLADELRDAEFTVVEAGSAREAMRELQAEGELVAAVSDLNLGPGGDGIDVLAEVGRRHPAACRILMTGTHDARADGALRDGLCARVILKPIRPTELVLAVCGLL